MLAFTSATFPMIRPTATITRTPKATGCFGAPNDRFGFPDMLPPVAALAPIAIEGWLEETGFAGRMLGCWGAGAAAPFCQPESQKTPSPSGADTLAHRRGGLQATPEQETGP